MYAKQWMASQLRLSQYNTYSKHDMKKESKISASKRCMHYKPAQLEVWPVVQVEPTSSAVQVARHVVTAATQEWHPLVPGDQSDMVCRRASLVNGQPVF